MNYDTIKFISDSYFSIPYLTVYASLIFLLIVELWMIRWRFSFRPASVVSSPDNIASYIQNQMTEEEKMHIKSRISYAFNAVGILSIFKDFSILQNLNLPVDSRNNDTESIDQAFRDLVREKIIANNVMMKLNSKDNSEPSTFKNSFLTIIESLISSHVTDSKLKKEMATHLCVHLSRTHSGGDSFFVVKSIFDSPQFVVTAFHRESHQPTALKITDSGWAVISITSHFNLYHMDDLSMQMSPLPSAARDGCAQEWDDGGGGTDMEESQGHPDPLVTVVTRTEEWIPVSKAAQLEHHRFVHRTKESGKSLARIKPSTCGHMNVDIFSPPNLSVVSDGWRPFKHLSRWCEGLLFSQSCSPPTHLRTISLQCVESAAKHRGKESVKSKSDLLSSQTIKE